MNHKRLFIILLLIVSSFMILSNLPVESAQIKKGEKAPVFSLYDTDGNKVTLSDFKGDRVVLIDFFASRCPHCIKGITVMNQLNKEYKNKAFKVIGIDIKESQKKVSSLIKKYNISYTMVLDKDGRVANAYNVRGIPFLVLIDKEGTIRWFGYWISKDAGLLIEKLTEE